MTTCPLRSSRSIFNNLHWRSQCQLIKFSYTKISPKGPPITWSCHITPTLVLLCLFTLWFLLTKAQPNTVPILDLGPPYDCHLSPVTAPGDIWIPLTEELFSQYATIGSHRYDIPWRISPIFFRCYHLPNLLLHVTKLLQWRATMITSSHEKLVIAPHNHCSCPVAHIYNQV